MAKEITVQELYDRLYIEAADRARKKGEKIPTEVQIFEVLVKSIRAAISRGEESVDTLAELSEVQSFHIREQEEQMRKDKVDRALREGNILDLDELTK